MDIRLKKLTMLNFKGVRNRSIDFSENVTLIQGRNRIGKTTVADACWWVLFGKDSKGNSSFGIKTNGENLQPIPHLDHVVTLTMTIDGEEVELKREYKEKWESKRGAEPQLTGHNVISYVNGNRMKEKEYKEYIDSLCSEQLFKILSKSEMFFLMNASDQRKTLIQMVGQATPEEYAQSHSEFADIVKQMTSLNLDIDQILTGIRYKITEVDKNIQDSDSRLKEQTTSLSTMMDECGDFTEIRDEIVEKDAQIESLQKKLAIPESRIKELSSQKVKAAQELSDAKIALTKMRASAETSLIAKTSNRNYMISKSKDEYNEALKAIDMYINSKTDEIKDQIIELEAKKQKQIETHQNIYMANMDARQRQIENYQSDIQRAKSDIDALERTIKHLEMEQEQYEHISATFRLSWTENETFRDNLNDTCPTCGQTLPPDRLKKIQEDADKLYDQRYNDLIEQAKKIKRATTRIEKDMKDANEKIVEARGNITKYEYNLEQAKSQTVPSIEEMCKADHTIQRYDLEIATLQKKLTASETALDDDGILQDLRQTAKECSETLLHVQSEQLPTVDEILRQNSDYAELCSKISRLESEQPTDTLAIEESLNVIKAEIDNVVAERDILVKSLGKESVIEDINKRIKDLMNLNYQLQQQKAELERQREHARDFQMAMIQDLESRVNAMFSGIQFRMFEKHLNDNIEPCCKCYIGVTEYKDGSHAERINAGLEMIDTISKYQHIYVPCFVDDAEGINQVYETKAQQIRLIATFENEMQIIHH